MRCNDRHYAEVTQAGATSKRYMAVRCNLAAGHKGAHGNGPHTWPQRFSPGWRRVAAYVVGITVAALVLWWLL